MGEMKHAFIQFVACVPFILDHVAYFFNFFMIKRIYTFIYHVYGYDKFSLMFSFSFQDIGNYFVIVFYKRNST